MQQEAIQIKKYGNRRLYSTTDARFITIQELAELVRKGSKVRVTDAESGADITAEVLTQILLENGRAQHFPVEILEQMIRLNEQAVQNIWTNYLEQSRRMFDAFQQNFRFFQQANPFFQWMEPPQHPKSESPTGEKKRRRK